MARAHTSKPIKRFCSINNGPIDPSRIPTSRMTFPFPTCWDIQFAFASRGEGLPGPLRGVKRFLNPVDKVIIAVRLMTV